MKRLVAKLINFSVVSRAAVVHWPLVEKHHYTSVSVISFEPLGSNTRQLLFHVHKFDYTVIQLLAAYPGSNWTMAYLLQNIMRFQARVLQSVSIPFSCINTTASWLAWNKLFCLYYILIAVIMSIYPLLFNTVFSLLYILFFFHFFFCFLWFRWTALGLIICVLQNKKIKNLRL